MNVGIIVEGDDDYETYPVLIQKLSTTVSRVRRVQCGGIRKLKTRFVGFLDDFNRNRAWNITKALVIRDSDCAGPQPLEQELQTSLDQKGLQLTFPVHFYATRCKLETLLLVDENAINQVSLRRGGGGGVLPVGVQLETYRDADVLFKRVLWQAGLPDDPTVYAEIAQVADTNRIAQRCPYFREFVARVRAY